MRDFFKTMFASMLGFFLTILLFFLFIGILISSVASSVNRTEEVEANSVLELKLSGAVPERLADNPFEGFNQGPLADAAPAVGLEQIIWGLEKAAKDNKIKGVVLRADYYAGGLGTAEEIRQQILAFRKSGKFVYAYADILTDGGFYIASACDKVYLNPKGFVEFNGFAGQVMLYKGLLDKLGVEFEVFKAGKYKSAVEPFTRNELSEPNKEQIRQYVTELYGHHLKQIALSRNLDSGALAETSNLFKARTAAKALEFKLVDGLKYYDEFEDELRSKLGIKEKDKKINKSSFAAYSKNAKSSKTGNDKIAVIYANGEIAMGKNESGDAIGGESLAQTIRKARLDKNIKAVVLRVNSPGGSSNASDIIAREVELCKKEKPVIVSFGNVAASGGYYIACVADSIFAYPNTITGSIGVFALVPNTQKMYKQHLGLSYETVPTGEYAVTWRPDQGLTPAMRSYFQGMVDEIYTDFISIVGRGRHIDTGRVAELAQGHVYTAMHAKTLGLVDGFGGLQRSIQSAAWKAKLKDYRLVSWPEMKSPIELLFGDKSKSMLDEKLAESELGPLFKAFGQANSVLKMTGPQMRMPWEIQVQ
ncbi:MAG: signal peptide peptidase SppA [Bacteroidetes bacterium]|nr:signal peptide peptidase SppA [Bacteroidota bacterium]